MIRYVIRQEHQRRNGIGIWRCNRTPFTINMSFSWVAYVQASNGTQRTSTKNFNAVTDPECNHSITFNERLNNFFGPFDGIEPIVCLKGVDQHVEVFEPRNIESHIQCIATF